MPPHPLSLACLCMHTYIHNWHPCNPLLKILATGLMLSCGFPCICTDFSANLIILVQVKTPLPTNSRWHLGPVLTSSVSFLIPSFYSLYLLEMFVLTTSPAVEGLVTLKAFGICHCKCRAWRYRVKNTWRVIQCMNVWPGVFCGVSFFDCHRYL